MKVTGIINEISNTNVSVSPKSFSVISRGGIYTLIINAESGWKITDLPEYISVEKARGNKSAAVKVVFERNDSLTNDRSGFFTVTSSTGESQTVSFVQEKAVIEYTYDFSASTNKIELDKFGTVVSVPTITSTRTPYVNDIVYGPKEEVSFTANTSDNWLRYSGQVFVADENPTNQVRKTAVTFTQNLSNKTITVEASQEESIITWSYHITTSTSEWAAPAKSGSFSFEFSSFRTKWLNSRCLNESVPVAHEVYKSGSFVSFTKTESTVQVSVTNNTAYESRIGEIVINVIADDADTYPIEGILPTYTFYVNQEGGLKYYSNLRITEFAYDSRDAAGGTLTPRITALADWTWNGEGDVSTDTIDYNNMILRDRISASLKNNIAECSIDNKTAVVTWGPNGDNESGDARSNIVMLIVTAYDLTVSAETTVNQLADQIDHYGDIKILSFTAPNIPASGGRVASGDVTYEQDVFYVSGKQTKITSGATVNYEAPVIASTKGTEESGETDVDELTVVVSLNDTYDIRSLMIKQDANRIENYGDVVISQLIVDDIPASGGSVSSGTFTCSQVMTYSSLAERTVDKLSDFDISYSAAISKPSKTTDISNQTSAGTLTVTVRGEGNKTATKSATVYQKGNWVESISSDASGEFSYPNYIPAKGGSVAPEVINSNITFTFSSGAESLTVPASTYGTLTVTNSYQVSDGADITINSGTGVVTGSNLQTAIKDVNSVSLRRIATYKWTPTANYNAKGTLSLIENNDSAAAQDGNWIESLYIPDSEIGTFRYAAQAPANGGTCEATVTRGLVRYVFTSEAETATVPDPKYGWFSDSVIYSLSDHNIGASLAGAPDRPAIEWEDRGDIPGEIRSVIVTESYEYTWLYVDSMGRDSVSSSSVRTATCSQQYNYADDRYSKPSIFSYNYDDFQALGGTHSANVGYQQTSYYTSGAYCAEYSLGGVLTYTGKNLPSGCTLDTVGNVTFSDLGTTIKNAVDVKNNLSVTVSLNGQTSDSFTCTSCKQEGNYIESIATQQGVLSYPAVSASGGTSTPTVTDPTVIYTYTSQDTSTETPSSTYGTLNVSSSYAIANVSGSSIDLSTGAVTWEDREATAGAERKAAVTKSYVYSWRPSSAYTYNNIDATGKALGESKQNANNARDHFDKPIISLSYSDKNAAAGDVTPTFTYEQQSYYTSNAKGDVIRSGATVEFSCTSNYVSVNQTSGVISWNANELGNERTASVSVKVTLNGKSDTKTVTVKQLKDTFEYSYGTPTVTASYATFEPWGGNYDPTWSFTQKVDKVYVSGKVVADTDNTSDYQSVTFSENIDWLSINSTSGRVTVNDLGTTVMSSDRTGTIGLIVTANGKASNKLSISVTQKKNVKTTITYGKPVVSLSYGDGDTDSKAASINPTMSYSQSRVQNYSSTVGNADNVTALTTLENEGASSIKYSGSATGATVNQTSGKLTWERHTDCTKDRSVTISCTVTANDLSETVTYTHTQKADFETDITYDIPVITNFTVDDIPAWGGSVSYGSFDYSQARIQNYNSGNATDMTALTGTINSSEGGLASGVTYGAAVEAGQLPAEESDRIYIGSLSVSYELNGRLSEPYSAEVYQEANYVTDTTYDISLSANKGTSANSPLSAGEDSTTITCGGSISYTWKSKVTSDGTFTPTITCTGDGFSYSTSTKKVSVASRGCTIETAQRSATVKATGNNVTKTITLYQAVNNRSIEGGVITYGEITGCTVTDAEIPASGGEKTATASVGKQARNITRKYYLYDSGCDSTIDEEVNDTVNITPLDIDGNAASLTASADQKPAQASDRNLVDSKDVVWTSKGDSSYNVTKTLRVYQAANSIKTTTYSIELTKDPTANLAAAGAQVTITAKGVISYKWYSDAYSYGAFTPDVSWTAAWLTQKSTSTDSSTKIKTLVLTASNHTDSSANRTATITATGNNKTTTLNITQNKGAKVYENVTAVLSYPNANPEGDSTSTPTLTYSQVWTWNGVANSGGTLNQNNTDSFTVGKYSIASTDWATINQTSGVLTLTSNESLSARTTGNVSVTVTGQGSKSKTVTATCTQKKGYYTYNDITFNTLTYGIVNSGGGASSPSIGYTQTYGWNGSTSGAGTINGGSNDDDFTTYSVPTTTGLTLNTSTGVATWAVNKGADGSEDSVTRSATVTATVTRNSKTATKTATTSQTGEKDEGPSEIEYGDWSFTVTPSSTSIAAKGGSSDISVTRPTRQVTKTYLSGDTITYTESATAGTFEFTRSNTTFTLSATSANLTSTNVPGVTLNVGATGATIADAISSTVTVKFTASNPTTGEKTKSVTSTAITRAKSEYKKSTYQFSSFSVAKSTFTAAAGSTTLSMVVQEKKWYTDDQVTNWATITPANNSIVITCGTGASAGAVSEGTTSTSTISVEAYYDDEKDRTITISGNYSSGKATKSITLTQTKDEPTVQEFNDPEILAFSYDEFPANGATYLPNLSWHQEYVQKYVSGREERIEHGSTKNVVYTSSISGLRDSSTGSLFIDTCGEYYYASRHSVGTVTVTVTGEENKTASATATVYRAANLITLDAFTLDAGYITCNHDGSTLSAAGSGGPVPFDDRWPDALAKVTSVTVSFTSGTTDTTTNVSKYGDTVVNKYSYSVSTTSYGGVTSAIGDSNNWAWEVYSRGTDWSTSTRDITFYRTATALFKFNSTYGGGSSGTKQATCSYTVTQAANVVNQVKISLTAGSISHSGGTIAAGGKDSLAISNGSSATLSAKIKFASGSEVNSSSTYGTLSGPTYSWASSNTNCVSLTSANATSLNVKVNSRGSEVSTTSRASVITRTASASFTLNSTYAQGAIYGSSYSDSEACSTTVTQEANTITGVYSASLSGGSLTAPGTYGAGGGTKSVASASAASGGSVTVNLKSGSTNSSGTSYGSWGSVSYSWSSNQSYATLTTSNAASLNVTMANRTTDGGASTRSATITRTASAKFTVSSTYGTGSKSASNTCTATVTQAANPDKSSFDAPVLSTFSYGTFAAAGATLTPSVAYSQQSYYASGSKGSVISSGGSLNVYSLTGAAFTLNSASTGSITASKNNSSSARTGSVYGKITLNGKTSSAVQASLSQSANTYAYAAWTVTVTNSGSTAAAAGGTVTVGASASRTYGWSPSTSGVGTQNGTITYSIKEAVNWASISGAKVTFANNTTTSSRSITVVCTCKEDTSKTKTITLTQSAGSKSYGNYTGTLTLSKSTVGAGADSVTVTYGNVYRGYTWNGVAGSGGNDYYSGTVAVTIAISTKEGDGGTSYCSISSNTFSQTTSGGTDTATISKSTFGTASMPSGQCYNVTLRYGGTSGTAIKSDQLYTSSNVAGGGGSAITTYGTPSVSIGSGITCSGGSATVTRSVSNTRTYYWTSGSVSSTASEAGTVTLSEIADNNNRFSLSGTTLSHSTMGANNTTDTCTIRAYNASSTSKYKDASVSVKNTYTDSGGGYTYGNVSKGTITNATIPASGGNATATAGNGSQSWSKAATIRTFCTGSTTTLEAASSGTYTIAPDYSSKYGSANSKGTNASAVTTVASQAVKWSGYGGKSATGTMYVYQAKNEVTNGAYRAYNDGYWASCSVSSGSITAGGGSVVISKTAGHTYYYQHLYTSGGVAPSSSTYYTSSAADSCTIALTTNGNSRYSLSGTTLSHSSMGCSQTTDNWKVTCTNSADKSATGSCNGSVSNTCSTTGGTKTYGTITAGSLNNAYVPASGGSATATAGNGSITYTISAQSTSCTANSSCGYVAASNGTEAVSPSPASLTKSGSNLACTKKVQTQLGYTTVTWSKGGKSTTGTLRVYQHANSNGCDKDGPSCTGGAYTYGNVSKGTITNGYISASGGSATAYAANGSQSYSKTAESCYCTYTSGCEELHGTNPATSGNTPIAANPSSYTASAGANSSTSQKTIGSKATTWSGYSGKSASGTMYVYQYGATPQTYTVCIGIDASDPRNAYAYSDESVSTGVSISAKIYSSWGDKISADFYIRSGNKYSDSVNLVKEYDFPSGASVDQHRIDSIWPASYGSQEYQEC